MAVFRLDWRVGALLGHPAPKAVMVAETAIESVLCLCKEETS
jgi:hypothetical protein